MSTSPKSEKQVYKHCKHMLNIPAIRQWPTGTGCDWCRKSMKELQSANLYHFSKNRACQLLTECEKCISQCKSQVRTCPGIEIVRDRLQLYAIQQLPKPGKRKI